MEEEEKVQIETLKFKEQIDQDLKVIKNLKNQIDKFEKERILFLDNSEKLGKLYQMGIIDNKGDPLPCIPDDPSDMK